MTEEDEYEEVDYFEACKRVGISPTRLTFIEMYGYGMRDPARDKMYRVKKIKKEENEIM